MPRKTFTLGSDVHISEGSPNTNLASSDILGAGVVKDKDKPSSSNAAFIKFDSADDWQKIPAGATIQKAMLKLNCIRLLSGERSDPFRVGLNTFSWDVSRLTYNNSPGVGGQGMTALDDFGATGGRQAEANVTEYVQRGKFADNAGEIRGRGLRIIGTKGNNVTGRADFKSSNAPGGPTIDVDYDAAAPTIDANFQGTNGGNGKVISGAGTRDAGQVHVYHSYGSADGPWNHMSRANENYGNGNWSVGDTSAAPAPGIPQTEVDVSGGTNVRVNWQGSSRRSRVKWYKARRELGDGTNSNFTSVTKDEYTPEITKYEVFRKIGRGNWTRVANVGPNVRTYLDTDVPLDTTLQYKVVATNEQGISSDFDDTGTDVNIQKPSAPSFTSLTTPGNEKYLLQGDIGAGSPTRINIYVSDDGAIYKKLDDIIVPQQGANPSTAWSYEWAAPVDPPESPTVSVQYLVEKAITLNWNRPANKGKKRWFKVSRTLGGIEGDQTTAKFETLTPDVNGFVLERKDEGENDLYYDQVYPASQGAKGDALAFTDTQVDFGKRYIYRLTAYNSRNRPAIPVTKTASAPKPGSPTIFQFRTDEYAVTNPTVPRSRVIKRSDKSEYIRVAGAGVNGADDIILERSIDGGVVFEPVGGNGEAIQGLPPDGVGSEEWWKDDALLPIQSPRVPTWSLTSRPVDTAGVHLRWTRPSNPVLNTKYRATRTFGNLRGTPSLVQEQVITPYIESYSIQRRETPLAGEERTIENEWKLIAVVSGTQANPSPATVYDDGTVLFDKNYDYRIIANNNFGIASEPSLVKLFSTFDAPPPPPPAPDPTKPTVSNGQPRGVVDVSGIGLVRLVWDYSHPQDEPQIAYQIKVDYTDESTVRQTRYWNGAAWITDAAGTTIVDSTNNHADVDLSFFDDGIDYFVTLTATAANGGVSDPHEWTISGALSYTVYFDTFREVKHSYSTRFNLYRKVQTREDELLGMPALSVGWAVQEQLPLEVDDTNWEGGGNSWSWVVFDNDGRPEAYAEIDFEHENREYHFTCDSRGRIVLTIPDDILPGIYTFRERGPSMAPRTIENFVVVDPWMIEAHGHRHAAEGPDPIYGVTASQIADQATIRPDQVEGAEALGELVNDYGSDMFGNLQRRVSSGHGFYVVEGLNYNGFNGDTANISSGSAWENGLYHDVNATSIPLDVSDNKTLKVYVMNGEVAMSVRNTFIPGTTPLYTLVVSGGIVTSTDERLRHPNNHPTGTVTPVRWGAETTDDLKHEDGPLVDRLGYNLRRLEERFENEEKLHEAFSDREAAIKTLLDDYNRDKLRSREAMLTVGYTTALRHLFAKFNKKAAENLMLENFQVLSNNRMDDITAFLSNIANGGLTSHSSHISSFSVGDELSSLTNVIIRNGVATLPNNWTRGSKYTLRTLRVEGPPANFLDFHLVYEDTGANFTALGSQSNNGVYIPKLMTKIRTVRDDRLKTLFNSPRNCFIDTYRVFFSDYGNESTVELVMTGGTSQDGVRLRGFGIVTA